MRNLAGRLRPDLTCVCLLTVAWAALALCIDPVGEFPINDDWVYAYSVRTLLDSGRLRVLDFTQAFGLPQIGLGLVVSDLAGFSFTRLRLLGLVFGWIGVLASYALARQFGAVAPVAALVAAAVGANPLYLALASTFMTDVPFFAFAVVSLALLVRGFQGHGDGWLVAGLLASIPAILTRQFGVVLPLGFGFAYAVTRPLHLRTLAIALAPVLLALGLHYATDNWLGSDRQSLSSMGWQGQNVQKRLEQLLTGTVPGLRNLAQMWQYLGLFTLPLSGLWLGRRLVRADRAQRRLLALRVIVWTLLMAGLLIPIRLFMPSGGNVLAPYGIGPMVLKDTYLMHVNGVAIPVWLENLWLVITALSWLGMALIVERVRVALGVVWSKSTTLAAAVRSQPVAVLLGATTAAYVFLVAVVASVYLDRYLILCLPLLCLPFVDPARPARAYTVQQAPRAGVGAAPWLWVVAMAAFSTLALHDSLEWHRQRWAGLRDLTQVQQIPPTKIDGGYEFNGWYLYRPGGARMQDHPRSWWWVTDDEYLVASGPVKGYREIASYPFRRQLLGTDARVVVLRRVGSTPAPP